MECVNGLVSGTETEQTCEDACKDNNGIAMCCEGTDACKGFTGSLSRDGLTCMGKRACSHSTIEKVVSSCRENSAVSTYMIYMHRVFFSSQILANYDCLIIPVLALLF